MRSHEIIKGLLRNHVRGKWVESGRVFEKINPVNGSKVCDVSEADSETVDRADASMSTSFAPMIEERWEKTRARAGSRPRADGPCCCIDGRDGRGGAITVLQQWVKEITSWLVDELFRPPSLQELPLH